MLDISFEQFDQSKHVDIWEGINHSSNNSSFLSSLDWIAFQKSLNREVYQFLIKEEKEKYIGIIYIEVSRRKFTKFAYTPYGPVLKTPLSQDSDNYEMRLEIFKQLKSFAKQFCKEQGLNYFKIDPMFRRSFGEDLKSIGWKKSLAIGQSKDSWVMGLGEDADELLKSFEKDTRYYVNRGLKKGVKVERVKSEKGVKDFINLMNETKERQAFANYGDDYYLKQWEFFHMHEGDQSIDRLHICEIYVAYLEEKPLAGALMNYYNGWVNYSHGASTSDKELSKLAAPYALHFEIMKDAIEKGFDTYNFWGVIPKGIEHYGRGFSMFKMKFPGEFVQFTGTYEVGRLTPSYFLNRLYDWKTFKNERY